GADEERTGVDAEGELAETRVVDLQRRAVLARLRVVRAAEEGARAVAEGALEHRVDGRVARVGFDVDGTALIRRDEHVAVRAKDVGGDVPAPRADPVRGEERAGAGALRAGADVER